MAGDNTGLHPEVYGFWFLSLTTGGNSEISLCPQHKDVPGRQPGLLSICRCDMALGMAFQSAPSELFFYSLDSCIPGIQEEPGLV